MLEGVLQSFFERRWELEFAAAAAEGSNMTHRRRLGGDWLPSSEDLMVSEEEQLHLQALVTEHEGIAALLLASGECCCSSRLQLAQSPSSFNTST